MPTEKDWALVQFLQDETDNGTVSWEPTASDAQYVAGFRGKYNITIQRGTDRDGDPIFNFTLTDVANGRELVSLREYGFGNRLSKLHERAHRQALDVDAAIDEIMERGKGDSH